MNQSEKAACLHKLHRADTPLLLPNIWDPLGALLLEKTGYSAVATASAAISFIHGYDDGNNLSFNTMLDAIRRICKSVDIPVTADIESGYAENSDQLHQNIEHLLETGVAGINFEDSSEDGRTLRPLKDQCRRIELVRKVADAHDIPLFINARCDVFITRFPKVEDTLAEAISRGQAYARAGASGYYPILIPDHNDFKKIQDAVDLPLNVLLTKNSPTVPELAKMGVNRISTGPALLRTAFTAMKNAVEKLYEMQDASLLYDHVLTSSDVVKYVREGKED